MPPVTTCPPAEVLVLFLEDCLAEAEAATVEDHLADCAGCAGRLHELLQRDALARALPQAALLSLETADDEKLTGLKRRLCALGTADGPTLSSTDLRTPAPDGLTQDQTTVLSLLQPPQQTGELGRLGGYRVLEVLGRGGMGVVFRAEDERLRRAVALKAIRPELAAVPAVRERFLREARAAAALAHDHVVPVYEAGEDGGTLYLAMPLLPGESLEDCLKREGRLCVPEVLRVGRELAEGLAAAHAAGLVHRDVKPANVWLEGLPPGPDGAPRRRARLLDFGLARTGGADARLTQTGAVVGTPGYLSPEQARGQAVDARTDLFSLGVVLYRLATGRLPFEGADPLSALVALAQGSPRPPRQVNAEVPPALNRLILRLLSRDPADRLPSARAVAEELAAIERNPAHPASPQRRRFRLVVAVAAAGLAGALALAVVLGPGRPAQQGPPTTPAAGPESGPPDAFPAAPDNVKNKREMVEQLLGLAARVTILDGDKLKTIEAPADLPAGEFEVVHFQLPPRKRLAELERLSLIGAAVGDEELEQLRGFVGLRVLQLQGTKVSDAGLARLAGLTRLEALGLTATAVSDVGLEQLRKLTNLRELHLQHTRISDKGLEHLRGLTRLEHLNLIGTAVGDAGLEFLRPLTNLSRLDVQATRVTDAGLRHLRAFPKLTSLDLTHTKVTDAGLAHLEGLTGLKELGLQHTRVGDDGLAHLKGLTNLTRLVLLNTQVGDAGLGHLRGLTRLENLVLFGTRVSDAGLEHLRGLTELKYLNLTGTRVTDAGAAAVRKALPKCQVVAGPAPP